ncbi:hypothetical protein C5167_010048, partial [Papaver somniferum]
ASLAKKVRRKYSASLCKQYNSPPSPSPFFFFTFSFLEVKMETSTQMEAYKLPGRLIPHIISTSEHIYRIPELEMEQDTEAEQYTEDEDEDDDGE